MIKTLLTISFTLFTSATIVHADANLNAGKQQAEACAGCHGETGNSTLASFPKLAGQHAPYLLKTLQSLKAGTRNAPMMAPLAMSLDEQAMIDLAAFYASQKISSNPMPILPLSDDDEDEEEEAALALIKEKQQKKLSDLLAKGRYLYRNGHLETKVSACIACHGLNGEGNQPAAYPTLSGQHADYLIKTLTDFKTGVRTSDTENMMAMIAKKMTAEEIQAVAYYLSVMDHSQATPQ